MHYYLLLFQNKFSNFIWKWYIDYLFVALASTTKTIQGVLDIER